VQSTVISIFRLIPFISASVIIEFSAGSKSKDRLLQDGVVADQADLARLGHVSRARVTQIMNLLQLAPDIQEAILFLPRIERGREPIREHHIRPIAATLDWRRQRQLWGLLVVR
jgi:hypothetical protein